MKSVAHLEYGPPTALKVVDKEIPQPLDDEIQVKVVAATVNRTDCAMLRARPFIMRFLTGLRRPRKTVTGTDFAGIVTAAGSRVSSFQVGDRVFCFDDSGVQSHAGYLTIKTSRPIVKIPDGTSFERAVACLEGTHYAYNFINKVHLQPGNWVMVNGGTGAIGSAAIQLARHFGARVTAVCRQEHFEIVKALGAERMIDYETEDFTKDESKYDFVFDAVGKSSFGRCKKLLKPGGSYISSELGWMAQNVFFALATPLLSRRKVRFPIPLNTARSIALASDLLVRGELDPLIDRIYYLTDIVEAFTYVESGNKVGSVLLKIDPEANSQGT